MGRISVPISGDRTAAGAAARRWRQRPRLVLCAAAAGALSPGLRLRPARLAPSKRAGDRLIASPPGPLRPRLHGCRRGSIARQWRELAGRAGRPAVGPLEPERVSARSSGRRQRCSRRWSSSWPTNQVDVSYATFGRGPAPHTTGTSIPAPATVARASAPGLNGAVKRSPPAVRRACFPVVGVSPGDWLSHADSELNPRKNRGPPQVATASSP